MAKTFQVKKTRDDFHLILDGNEIKGVRSFEIHANCVSTVVNIEVSVTDELDVNISEE